jgi:hypothetical protein
MPTGWIDCSKKAPWCAAVVVKGRISKMKVFYASSKYSSHSRVARMYQSIIMEGHQLVTCLDLADAVILHIEPRDYRSLYSQHPVLADKYVIACCVWEATAPPEEYKRSLAYVQEIWTCSKYCLGVFQAFHNNVVYVPYVVERLITCTDEDRNYVKCLVGYQSNCVYYLAIARLWDKRKNVEPD